MAEGEVTALKETLRSQSLNMKRLYTELEEERNASATATEEALSMILRLQEEKATEKLEAYQYKRLAEEKMRHAEESQTILEEAMFEKEMEIASLKYQVQAYKHQLFRISVNNPDIGELKIVDLPFSKRSSVIPDRSSFPGFIRRNFSLPAVHLDQLCSEIDTIDEDSYLLPRRQSSWKKIDECMAQLSEKYEENQMQSLSKEYVIEECDSDREHDEEANIKMKELSQTRNVKDNFKSESISTNNKLEKAVAEDPVNFRDCRSCSCYSAVNVDASYDSTVGGRGIKLNDGTVLHLHSQTEEPGNLLECHGHSSSCLKTELNGNTTQSISVQDTQVLESHGCCIRSKSYKQDLQEPILEAENIIRMPHSMPQEAVDIFLSDDDLLRKGFMLTHGGIKLSTSREDASKNYHLTAVDPKIAVSSSQTEVEQLKKWLQKLENDIRIMKQEYSNGGKEQLKLLRNIHDQLSTIQLDIKSSEVKKCTPQDDSSLLPLTEAMLYFWL